jgi:aspartyl-tRNA(Asn)/glutamyl-tRNA(Gln) amidotransferase subunit C
MALTLEEVRHIAELARLRLGPDEERRFAGQLSAILDYASRLKQVDTAAISPTTSVLPVDAPLRGDLPRPSQPPQRWLANAASVEDGMFRVPPVFDEEP